MQFDVALEVDGPGEVCAGRAVDYSSARFMTGGDGFGEGLCVEGLAVGFCAEVRDVECPVHFLAYLHLILCDAPGRPWRCRCRRRLP